MGATSVGEIGLDLVVNQNQFNKQMSGITGMAKKAGAALAGAFAVKKIVDFGKQCMELGSDLQEVQNVVDVTFPSMTAKVDAFAKNAAQSFGLSETMAKQYTGTFGAMAKAFGFSESAAYDMGTALTGLAGDVASFYNLSQDEAYTKLKSVFTGETETLKDLGVVMTQAALDQYALANGYGKTTAAMTEQEKVALRYAFVQKQLSAAQGDFARTSGSWANQTKVMSLQLQSIMATIGQGLINLFTPVIKVVNVVLGKIATLANAFKAFTELITGKKSSGSSAVSSPVSELAGAADTASAGLGDTASAADDLSKSTSGVGSAAKKAAKEMRALMGFDQVNKISENETDSGGSDTSSPAVGGGGSALGSAVDFGSLAEGETILEETEKEMSALYKRAKELAALFKKGFKIGFGDSKKKIASIQKGLDGIRDSLFDIANDAKVKKAAKNFVDSFALSLGKLVGSATSIGLSIADNLVGGVDKYLKSSSGYIKDRLISMFDAGTAINSMVGDFATAIANILDLLSGANAKSCTAAIIGIFSDGFLGIIDLAGKFSEDIIGLITKPFTDNQDAIKSALDGSIGRIGEVLTTLHESLKITFQNMAQMYEEHLAPMFEAITSGVSSIVGAIIDGWSTYISPVLDELVSKFETVWVEHIQPLIDTAIELIGKIGDLISALWVNIIQPLVTDFIETSAPMLGEAISGIGTFFMDLLATVADVAGGILSAFGGVLDFLTGVFSGDWQMAMQGLQVITEGLRNAVQTAFNFIRNSILQPFDEFLKVVFEKDWTETFGELGEVLNGFFDVVETVWDTIKGVFEGIMDFITDAFAGDWSDAWDDIVGTFSTVFGGIVDIAKAPINAIIGFINGMLSGLESGLNAVVGKVNSLSFQVPDWVPGIGGQIWGFNLPYTYFGRIPYLAEGAFVKPNTPQLAMIGDNRHQGEVVAPEDKLQAMVDAAVASVKPGVTKEELESMINNAVMRIIAALASLGFNVDGQELSKLMSYARADIDRRFNVETL